MARQTSRIPRTDRSHTAGLERHHGRDRGSAGPSRSRSRAPRRVGARRDARQSDTAWCRRPCSGGPGRGRCARSRAPAAPAQARSAAVRGCADRAHTPGSTAVPRDRRPGRGTPRNLGPRSLERMPHRLPPGDRRRSAQARNRGRLALAAAGHHRSPFWGAERVRCARLRAPAGSTASSASFHTPAGFGRARHCPRQATRLTWRERSGAEHGSAALGLH